MDKYKIYLKDKILTILAHDYVVRANDCWNAVAFYDDEYKEIGQFSSDDIIGWIKLDKIQEENNKNIINNFLSVENWIPINKELPKLNNHYTLGGLHYFCSDTVIVTLIDGNVTTAYCISKKQNDKTNYWYSETDIPIRVTAWMPFPKSYNDDNNNYIIYNNNIFGMGEKL